MISLVVSLRIVINLKSFSAERSFYNLITKQEDTTRNYGVI